MPWLEQIYFAVAKTGNCLMRVMLTGASGFIGAALLKRFVQEGWQIEAVHRSPAGPSMPGVRWHQVDLWREEEVRRLIREIQATHLVLSAWVTTPSLYRSSPDNLRWLEATTSLLHAFGAGGGKSVVGIGSCMEYDWTAENFVEDKTPERPDTLYGQAKLAASQTLFALKREYGFNAVWGRVFMPFGPNDAPERLVPAIIRHLTLGQEMPLSQGRQILDFVYVDDVAEAVVRLLRKNTDGVFNLGTGTGTSVRDMALMIADHFEAMDCTSKTYSDLLKFGAREERKEPASLVADITKLRNTLGWQPEISTVLGIERMLAGDPSHIN